MLRVSEEEILKLLPNYALNVVYITTNAHTI